MSLNDKAFKNTENRDMDNSFCRPRVQLLGSLHTGSDADTSTDEYSRCKDCRSQGPGPIDISASTWQKKKVKSKQRVIEGAQKEGKTAHFATLMIYVTSRTQHWTIMIFRNIKSETYSSDLQYWVI